MNWSLNEIESLTRKATRGAGYSWGLAEEAGKSVRVLTTLGFPGAEILVALLETNDRRDYSDLCPQLGGARASAREGQLCPIVSGCMICDMAQEIGAGNAVSLGATDQPLLLVPFVSGAAKLSSRNISILWEGVTLTCIADGSVYLDDQGGLAASFAQQITVELASAAKGKIIQTQQRGDLSEAARSTLNAFAHRTYAPDTAESRLSGAGAGLTDND